jgi:mannose-6-phosphate isomerase-like protein (cupin superfamily)
MRRVLPKVLQPTLIGLALFAGAPLVLAAQESLADRISHTDPSSFRQLTSVHAGAGGMAFTGLLGRGAIGPHFNFMHRGEIPAGSGIGHHFHNTVEEMFIILDGEAQFTIDGRTAVVQGPAGVLCRMGHSHAILNSGSQTLQWMNLQAGSIAGVSDAFDLGDDRVGAVLDPVPPFMTVSLDPGLIRPAGGRGRGGQPVEAEPSGVQSRRAYGPTVFASAWAYIDHVLVAPGAATPARGHEDIGEAYYVLSGSGTVTVGSETAPVGKWDAIPVGLDETSSFTNTGTEPLELLVMGVARDMETKLRFMSEGNRQR